MVPLSLIAIARRHHLCGGVANILAQEPESLWLAALLLK
jgi:hypothetical protein